MRSMLECDVTRTHGPSGNLFVWRRRRFFLTQRLSPLTPSGLDSRKRPERGNRSEEEHILSSFYLAVSPLLCGSRPTLRTNNRGDQSTTHPTNRSGAGGLWCGQEGGRPLHPAWGPACSRRPVVAAGADGHGPGLPPRARDCSRPSPALCPRSSAPARGHPEQRGHTSVKALGM